MWCLTQAVAKSVVALTLVKRPSVLLELLQFHTLVGEKSLTRESKQHPEALGYIRSFEAKGFQMEHLVHLSLTRQKKPLEMKEKCQLCKNFHPKTEE